MKRIILAVTLSLISAFCTRGIEVLGPRGNVRERDHIKGAITHIDSRTVTVHWMVDKSMRLGLASYEQTYQLTAETQYRNCTLASLTRGTTVRIWGHGFTAETIEIASKP